MAANYKYSHSNRESLLLPIQVQLSEKPKIFCCIFITFLGPTASLKSDSHLAKKLCYLLDWKPFKNDEKCFLFHLESSFCSQDIYVFVTTFGLLGKMAWLER